MIRRLRVEITRAEARYALADSGPLKIAHHGGRGFRSTVITAIPITAGTATPAGTMAASAEITARVAGISDRPTAEAPGQHADHPDLRGTAERQQPRQSRPYRRIARR
jgi:hypothetical protein